MVNLSAYCHLAWKRNSKETIGKNIAIFYMPMLSELFSGFLEQGEMKSESIKCEAIKHLPTSLVCNSGLSTRCKNKLKKLGIYSVRECSHLSEPQLVALIRNKKSINQIKEWLCQFALGTRWIGNK